jgi:hypothetical protein
MKTNTMAQALRLILLKLSGAIVTAGIVFFASEAKGQVRPQAIGPPPPVQIFPWGSTNALEQFAATNTQNMIVGIYQGITNGGEADFPHTLFFPNMAAINGAFQQGLLFTANLALTNAKIDKTQPVFVGGYAWNDNYPPPPNGGWFPFDVPWDPVPSFRFVMQNGVWTIPDLSGISMILPEQMIFYVPGLEWARIEVYASTNLITPFLVVDSASNPVEFDASIDTTNQSMTIDTPYLASGNTGQYRLKVSILTAGSGFQIANGNGMQTAETPFSIVNFSIRNGIASFNVIGGDTGRVFVIQHSPDLINWATASEPYTVSGSGVSFQEPMIASPTNTSTMVIQSFAVNNGTASFKVAGGHTNTVFTVEKSPDLVHWTKIGVPQYQINTAPIPFSETIGSVPGTSGFYRTSLMTQMFYRTVTTNVVP